MKKIKPTGIRVLLKELKEDNIKGGIVLPDSVENNSNKYQVLEIGSLVTDVSVGDIVIVGKYDGTPIVLEQQEYKLINEDEILAIIG